MSDKGAFPEGGGSTLRSLVWRELSARRDEWKDIGLAYVWLIAAFVARWLLPNNIGPTVGLMCIVVAVSFMVRSIKRGWGRNFG